MLHHFYRDQFIYWLQEISRPLLQGEDFNLRDHLSFPTFFVFDKQGRQKLKKLNALYSCGNTQRTDVWPLLVIDRLSEAFGLHYKGRQEKNIL